MYKLWNMLAEMQSDAYEWVELSHSMEAAGHLIALAAELAAGMQDGEDNLDGRDLLPR